MGFMNTTPSARSGKKFRRTIIRLICIQSAYAHIIQTGESLFFFTNNDNEIYGYTRLAVFVYVGTMHKNVYMYGQAVAKMML